MERGIYHGLARSDHNFKPQWLLDPRESGPPRTGVVLIERYYTVVPPERVEAIEHPVTHDIYLVSRETGRILDDEFGVLPTSELRPRMPKGAATPQ